ncbi:TPA: hypothetical protein RQN23_002971 [Aeromonas veronii]|nr:hypothetical protein [Aeromonas veronii]
MSHNKWNLFYNGLTTPFGENTIRARNKLGLSSLLGVVVALFGVLPTKVAALGVEFSISNQKAFIAVLFIAVIYHIACFIVNILSDIMVWRVVSCVKSEDSLMELKLFDISHLNKEQILNQVRIETSIERDGKAIIFTRLAIEVLAPVAFGFFSLANLFIEGIKYF